MKHTPGPWEATGTTVYSLMKNEKGREQNRFWALVQTQRGGAGTDECIANVKLIAAAPDLLAALKVMTVMHCPCSKPIGAPGSNARKEWEDECVEYERAMAAIRKAEGN